MVVTVYDFRRPEVWGVVFLFVFNALRRCGSLNLMQHARDFRNLRIVLILAGVFAEVRVAEVPPHTPPSPRGSGRAIAPTLAGFGMGKYSTILVEWLGKESFAKTGLDHGMGFVQGLGMVRCMAHARSEQED